MRDAHSLPRSQVTYRSLFCVPACRLGLPPDGYTNIQGSLAVASNDTMQEVPRLCSWADRAGEKPDAWLDSRQDPSGCQVDPWLAGGGEFSHLSCCSSDVCSHACCVYLLPDHDVAVLGFDCAARRQIDPCLFATAVTPGPSVILPDAWSRPPGAPRSVSTRTPLRLYWTRGGRTRRRRRLPGGKQS